MSAVVKQTKNMKLAIVIVSTWFLGLEELNAFCIPRCHNRLTSLKAVDPLVAAYTRAPRVNPNFAPAPAPAVVVEPDTTTTTTIDQVTTTPELSFPAEIPDIPEVTAPAATPAMADLASPIASPSGAKAQTLYDFIKTSAKEASSKPISQQLAEAKEKTSLFPKIQGRAPPRSNPDEAPRLVDYLKEASSKPLSQQIAETKEKALAAKEQFVGSIKTMQDTVDQPEVAAQVAATKQQAIVAQEKLASSVKAMQDAVGSADASLKSVDVKSQFMGAGDAASQNVMAKVVAFGGAAQMLVREHDWAGLAQLVHFDEALPWLVATFAIYWGITQRESGRDEMRAEFEARLTDAEGKAKVAAESATLAAEGAKVAKSMVADTPPNDLEKSKLLLESSKARALEVEVEIMQKKMQRMKDQEVLLNRKVQEAERNAAEAKQQVLDSDTARMETANRVEMLSAEIQMLKKQLGGEPVAPEPPATAPAAPEPVVAAAPPAPVPKAAAKAKKAKKAAKKTAAKKGAAKVVAKKGAAKIVAKKGAGKTAAKKKAAKTAAKKKAAKTAAKKKADKVAVTSVVNSGNPWAELSASALKRKTVKDLTGYLGERGVETLGDNGKALKKDVLVALVQRM